MFADVQFMTAKEKQMVLKQWRTFLRHGCQYCHFTKRLYNHLIQHCQFIAHGGRDGFYRCYFGSGDRRVLFFTQFDASNGSPPPSIEYGMTYWATNPDYADVNQAMIEAATPYLDKLLKQAKQQQREADIRVATVLLGKHGLTIAKE